MSDALVPVTKDGTTIEVHPNALEEHLKLGWKKVEEIAEEVVEKIEKVAKPPKK